MTMNIRQLFAKKSAPQSNRQPSETLKIDACALDACVGGRMETDGVGVYLRSTESRAH
jgi:hypothetical protein